MVALQICQGLQDLGWIEPLSDREPGFKDDFVLYIPGPVSLTLNKIETNNCRVADAGQLAVVTMKKKYYIIHFNI
jgi:hypothetical protein